MVAPLVNTINTNSSAFIACGSRPLIEPGKPDEAAALHVAVERVHTAADAAGHGGHVAGDLAREPGYQPHPRTPSIRT